MNRKTLEDYMQLPYRMELVKDRTEGGYTVTFPDLPGCITCGDTLETAVTNAEDAKREWLRIALEQKYEIREPMAEEEYSGQFKIRIPKSLHRLLADHSRREGISMNQYCVYLLSRNDALNEIPAEKS